MRPALALVRAPKAAPGAMCRFGAAERHVDGKWAVLGDTSEPLRRLSSFRQVLRIEPERALGQLSEAVKLKLHSASRANWGNIVVLQTGNEAHVAELRSRADGSLDYPDSVLEKFEVVIASIHARHRMDRSTMTKRLISALSVPIFKIWGHGLGRILNHREAIDCDVRAVLDALAGSRGAVELNSDPHRLDLPPEWIPAARERNIPFVISVDAHSTRGFDVLGYGVTMARRGRLRRSEVLNTQSAERFAALVRPTQGA